jgi:hypothetical protein
MIVRISIFINLASNILLLASKKYFLTSQGLVGAGMNRRALPTSPISFLFFTVFQKIEVLKLEDGLLELKMY